MIPGGTPTHRDLASVLIHGGNLWPMPMHLTRAHHLYSSGLNYGLTYCMTLAAKFGASSVNGFSHTDLKPDRMATSIQSISCKWCGMGADLLLMICTFLLSIFLFAGSILDGIQSTTSTLPSGRDHR
jgi:hypothetical protein